jgi:hypothetical protein
MDQIFLKKQVFLANSANKFSSAKGGISAEYSSLIAKFGENGLPKKNHCVPVTVRICKKGGGGGAVFDPTVQIHLPHNVPVIRKASPAAHPCLATLGRVLPEELERFSTSSGLH